MNITAPSEGPLHPQFGPYVKNIQPIEGTTLFIADSCRGVKGRGRIWQPVLVRRNPLAGQPISSWPGAPLAPEWQTVGSVKDASGSVRVS
jgi:hypothetical protein